jgi:flagellar protein FliO/FliZ
MNTSSEIWVAFARTFSMLFLVLAVALIAVYLMKKMATSKGTKGGKNFIKVLAVHHLSPKEKLVLLDVLGDILLVGVTPAAISKLSSFDREMDLPGDGSEAGFKFSDFLTQKLGRSFHHKAAGVLEKKEGE